MERGPPGTGETLLAKAARGAGTAWNHFAPQYFTPRFTAYGSQVTALGRRLSSQYFTVDLITPLHPDIQQECRMP